MHYEADYLCRVLGSFIKKTEPPVQSHGIPWPHFEKMAARNLVMPIVHYVIGDSGLPLEFSQRWNQQAIGIELHHARARAATLKLCQILESEGIPAVVLRGMALAQWIYPSPALRPMVDVDILVAPTARHILVAGLEKRGLSPTKMLRSQFVYQIDGVVFEIHWSFLTPKRYRDTVDAAAWLASRRLLPGWDGMVFGLSPENELIELVCHSFIHHELNSLLPLVDIGLVSCLDGLDWRYISDWCEQASVGRLFWFTIAFVDALFNLGLPQKTEPAGVRYPPIQKHVFEAYWTPLFAKDARSHFLHRKLNLLHVAETPMIKLRQVVRLLNLDQLGRLFLFRPEDG
jgi:hypothetical protein